MLCTHPHPLKRFHSNFCWIDIHNFSEYVATIQNCTIGHGRFSQTNMFHRIISLLVFLSLVFSVHCESAHTLEVRVAFNLSPILACLFHVSPYFLIPCHPLPWLMAFVRCIVPLSHFCHFWVRGPQEGTIADKAEGASEVGRHWLTTMKTLISCLYPHHPVLKLLSPPPPFSQVFMGCCDSFHEAFSVLGTGSSLIGQATHCYAGGFPACTCSLMSLPQRHKCARTIGI